MTKPKRRNLGFFSFLMGAGGQRGEGVLNTTEHQWSQCNKKKKRLTFLTGLVGRQKRDSRKKGAQGFFRGHLRA